MAIIGHGDIASVLNPVDREDRIYFASGVSNSGETRESEYQREIDLLRKQDSTKRLVYFSSLCIFSANTRYSKHKREMETFVKCWFPSYTIIRLGNISWGTHNPHTLINAIREKIRKREQFEVKDVYRYVCDMEEFLYWIGMIPPDWSCEMNIIGRRMKVKDIVKEYCYPWRFDESHNLNSVILEGQCSYT
jgi:hypothetical protein